MEDQPPYRTPGWVKVVGIIALVLIVLIGVVRLTGLGRNHGPGLHTPGGDTSAPAGAVALEYAWQEPGRSLAIMRGRGADVLPTQVQRQ
jgi:hypothetical protein